MAVRGPPVSSVRRRHPLPRDLPALSGVLPGFVSAEFWGMAAPAATPSAIADKLSNAIAKAPKQPDVARRLPGMNVGAMAARRQIWRCS
ncbi:MAG: hypothetical protein EXR27_17500 [Betaproteobacteria bacterium]|nr:hypothetical protein [Betaproteobacteria bacterium]